MDKYAKRFQFIFWVLAGGVFLLLSGNCAPRFSEAWPSLAVKLAVILLVYAFGTRIAARTGALAAGGMLFFYALEPATLPAAELIWSMPVLVLAFGAADYFRKHPATVVLVALAVVTAAEFGALAVIFPGALLLAASYRDRQCERWLIAILRRLPAFAFLGVAIYWAVMLHRYPDAPLPVLIPAIVLASPALLAWRIEYVFRYSRRAIALVLLNAMSAGVIRLMVVEPYMLWTRT